MKYEEALGLWGLTKLMEAYRRGEFGRMKSPDFDPSTITVDFEFDEGSVCCGRSGGDPDCSCWSARDPRAEVRITGYSNRTGHAIFTSIRPHEFDLAKILGEIIDAGDGILSKE